MCGAKIVFECPDWVEDSGATGATQPWLCIRGYKNIRFSRGPETLVCVCV